MESSFEKVAAQGLSLMLLLSVFTSCGKRAEEICTSVTLGADPIVLKAEGGKGSELSFSARFYY